MRDLASHAWPFAALAVLPFLVMWRLCTGNPLDRAIIWQDVTDAIYPFLMFSADSIARFHEIPRWAWGIYSGLPFSSSFCNYLLYPINILFFRGILDPSRQGVYHGLMLAHLSIAGISLHLLARSYRIRVSVAFLGACTYVCGGFTTYMFVAGYPWFIVHAWLPLALFFIRKFTITTRPVWCVGLSAATFLLVGSLMPLLLIPSLYFMAAFFIVSVVVERQRQRWIWLTAWSMAAVAIGFLLHGAELLPIVEASSVGSAFKHSMYLDVRDRWMDESALRFLSNFFLGGDLAIAYMSAAGGLAVLIGLWLRRGRYWLLWAVTFMTAITGLALSKDFSLYDFFYTLIPGMTLLPSPERGIGLLYELSASFLAMAAFSSIGRIPRLWQPVAILLAAAAVLLWIVCRPDDQSALSAFRHAYAAWILATAISLFLIGAMRWSRNRRAVLRIASAFVLISVVSILTRTFETRLTPLKDLQKLPFHPAEQGSAAEVFSESPYVRGRSVTEKLPSINVAREYRSRDNVALVQGRDNVAGYYQFVPFRTAQAFTAAGFIDSYIFHGAWAEAFDMQLRWPAATVTKLYGLSGGGKGRVWLAPTSLLVADPPLKIMADPHFDPYRTVFLEPESRVMAKEFANGAYAIQRSLAGPTPQTRPLPVSHFSLTINNDITLVRQTPNAAAFRLERDIRGETLVFSDNWYPGWNVYVNGRRNQLFVADYAFKGVSLHAPKGTIVEFVFDSPSVRAGIRCSYLGLACFVILTAVVLLHAAAQRRKERVTAHSEPLDDGTSLVESPI